MNEREHRTALTVEQLESRDAPTVSGVDLGAYQAYAGGKGDAPIVQLWQGGQLACQFLAFPETFRGGVELAVSDTNGDGTLDLVCGAGPGGLPEMKIFSGTNLSLLADRFTRVLTPGDASGVQLYEMLGPFYTLDQADRWLLANGIGNCGVTDVSLLEHVPQEMASLAPGVWATVRAAGGSVVLVPGPGVDSYPSWAALADQPDNLGQNYRFATGATDGLLSVVVASPLASPIFAYEVGHLADAAFSAVPGTPLSSQDAWLTVWRQVDWLRDKDNGAAYAAQPAEAFAEGLLLHESGTSGGLGAASGSLIDGYFSRMLTER